MASLNKVFLIGRLGSDPEVKYTQSGKAVCSINLATTGKEDTEWHRLVFWDRLAEIVGEYTQKGSQLFVEGRLATRQWEDKGGNTRYTTEIIVQSMQMLDKKGDAPNVAVDKSQPDEEIPF